MSRTAKAAAQPFDVLVIGDEPAAAAGALHAARNGLSVGLLTSGRALPDELDWLSPPGVKLCDSIELKPAQCDAGVWTGLTLQSWDLQRRIQVRDAALSGWIVARRKLGAALLEAAVAAGVQHIKAAPQIELHDDHVRIPGATPRQSKIGLIADDLAADAAARQNTRILARPRPSTTCATVDTPALGKTASLLVVPPALRDGPLAVWRSDGKRARLTVFTRRDADHAMREMEQLLAAAVREKLLTAIPKSAPQIATLPAGDALETETHVAKRLLLFGVAGGFVAAASTEYLYPSLRSGIIAADTAGKALRAKLPQDELAQFDSAWRGALADCVRPLHTDLSLLTPLLFTNEQMALRLARALLLGQPF